MVARLYKKLKLSMDVKYSRLEHDNYMYNFDALYTNNFKKKKNGNIVTKFRVSLEFIYQFN